MDRLRSMTAKLCLLTCLFVLAVIALMSKRLLQNAEQALFSEMEVRAEFFARSARESIFPRLDRFELHFLVQEMLKEQAVTEAAVLDATGRVLSHSVSSRIGQRPADPLTRAALRSGVPLLQRVSAAGGRECYDLSVPILVGRRRVGTARLGFDRSSVREALRRPQRQILLITAATTALGILGTALIVGWIIRPLPRLAEAVREVGRGNFDVQVPTNSRDEIGILARAFNDMALANKRLFGAINEEREKLARIFHGTREGVILVDRPGRIQLINASARALLGCPGAEGGLTLGQAAAAFQAIPPLQTVLDGDERTASVELTRRVPKLLILEATADRLGARDGAGGGGRLFILRDVTLEKRGESLARDLLSSVSHKLRTPLAVALGFLELLEQDQDNLTDFQKQALAKIRQEDEHLRSLVEKLLTVSAAQNPETIVLERGEVALQDCVRAALKSLADALPGQESRVDWRQQELARLPRVQADPLLLKEAVLNLLENALKFNPRADRKASLTAAVADGVLRLSVRDNGPGIPSEEQSKVFRKFYQIDEDFTGQVPGLGLGLAFVKNVIEAHGGEVGLRSDGDQGSEFYFTLPLG